MVTMLVTSEHAKAWFSFQKTYNTGFELKVEFKVNKMELHANDDAGFGQHKTHCRGQALTQAKIWYT